MISAMTLLLFTVESGNNRAIFVKFLKTVSCAKASLTFQMSDPLARECGIFALFGGKICLYRIFQTALSHDTD